jgi:hypothetical protein
MEMRLPRFVRHVHEVPMSSVSEIDRLIHSVARTHNGLVPTKVLYERNISTRAIARRVSAGQLHRAFPGVVAVWFDERNAFQRASAGVLSIGAGHVSHLSALSFHGATLERVAAHISVPSQVRLPRITSHRQPEPDRKHLLRVHNIAVSRPWLAVVESAAILDSGDLAVAMDSLVQNGSTSLTRIQRCAEEHGSFRGCVSLQSLLNDRLNGMGLVRGFFERDLDRILRKANLPSGVRNHRLILPNGRKRELDRAWPEWRIGMEAHSWKYHSNTTDWGRTMTRDRMLTAYGWTILPVVVADTRDPSSLLTDLRLVLSRVVSQMS